MHTIYNYFETYIYRFRKNISNISLDLEKIFLIFQYT